MRRLWAAAIVWSMGCVGAWAQDGMPVDFPSDPVDSMPGATQRQEPAPRRVQISLGELQPTPEMWFYEEFQQQRQDPWVAIRNKAEFRANQRERRIAARDWYGYSASRPTASPTPYNDAYSPYWRGNGLNPFAWQATTPVTIIERSAAAPGVRSGLW